MKKLFITLILLVACVVIVKAEGITFPVPELENCSDKESCRAYCDEAGHMDACIKFAQTHGLMNKTEADRAQKFKDTIIKIGGPGGCDGPKECRAFCSVTANLEVCLAFAKKQGIKDEFVNESEKILKYVKSGGEMPGGCTSKESCAEYCKDFSHADECLVFSKKADIDRREEGFEKFIEFTKTGDTPGGCKNKDECERYCRDNAHRENCLEFAVRAGILSRQETDNIKNSGNSGPGGCTSSATCGMYCDYPGHREECVKFAEERGYMTKDESKSTNEGLVSVRAGLERVPAEVNECLKSNLGENILNNIQTGNLVPGPGIGVQVRSCFEKFGKIGNPSEFLNKAPATVAVCVKEKLGIGIEALKLDTANLTPEMADTVRVCFQSNEIQKMSIPAPAPAPENALRNFFRTAPREILPCIREVLGGDFDRIIAGENIPVDTSKIKICFDRFHSPEPVAVPTEPPLPKPSSAGAFPAINLSQFPPEIVLCIKTKIGSDTASFIARPDAALRFEIIVKECIGSSLPPPPPPPSPTPIPTSTSIIIFPPPSSGAVNDTICIQVITPARDPVTGACKLFATPCNVPANWIKVERCESDNTTIPSSTNTIAPTSYAGPSFSVAQVFQPILSIFGIMLK